MPGKSPARNGSDVMASALDAARYLIFLASPSEDEDADCLSHLRIQKLLYYVQGWHLAALGTPLFSARIEAWTHGPVVPEVYSRFSVLGCQPIPPRQGEDSAALSLREKEFIRSVWDQYKQHSATALRDMTHQEVPWVSARRGLGPNERSNEEITNESMRVFFAPKLEDWLVRCDPKIDKAKWARSREEIEAGRVQTTREIRRGIRGGSSESNQG